MDETAGKDREAGGWVGRTGTQVGGGGIGAAVGGSVTHAAQK